MMNSLPPLAGPTQDKINRELFVGNTPPGTSELLLLHFLSAAMKRVNLCQPHETPVLGVRVSSKFAFVELSTVEIANKVRHWKRGRTGYRRLTNAILLSGFELERHTGKLLTLHFFNVI